MTKRLFAALLCTLLLCAATLPAYAALDVPTYPPAAMQAAPHATPAEMARLYAMVFAANTTIELLVAFAQFTPYNDIAWLQMQERHIVDAVKRYADSIGATVVCVYTEYIIDGQRVLIDPLRVVN